MLVQKGTSLAQRRSSAVSALQGRVAAFLKDRASKVSSPVLALVATRMQADPFTKVKKMINDMISKLMEEANEEAEHKAWCDTEMATNKHTRDAKTEEADKLSAEIDFLTAKSAKLSEDITELSNGIATLDKAVAEATSDREAEKAKNTETIADAKAATTAVSQAMAVLKEFYAKAGEATALMQSKGPAEDAPETFDSSYQGNQDQAGGVMGMLEVIQSDFAELESTTTAAEAEADDTFTTYSNDSKTNKAVKETDVQHKTTAKQETESAIQEAKKDLASTYEELTAATDYYGKLKPTCVEEAESYEDKVARRKQEIDSLKEALDILSGDDIAV
jgi:DNA repair exonuclease SbcCD ATPase subunit